MKQYDVKISHAALSDMEQIYSFHGRHSYALEPAGY